MRRPAKPFGLLAVTALLPFAVGMMITFVNGNIGLAVATGGIFALTRFRSAQSTSDEIAAVLIAVAGGVAFGMGYLAYGVLTLLCLSLLCSWQARSVSRVHAIPSSSPQPMVGRSRSVHTPAPSSLVLRNFAVHAQQRPQWD